MAISQSITDEELDDLRFASSLLATLLSSLESCRFLFVTGCGIDVFPELTPFEVIFSNARNSSGGLSNVYKNNI
jgi:hypothetical protein